MIYEIEQSVADIISGIYEDKGPVVLCGVDDLSAYTNLSVRGSIFIRYMGATYVPNGKVVSRNWRIMIMIAMKKYAPTGDNASAYEIIDKLRGVFYGRPIMPKGLDKPRIILRPESEGFIREEKQIWWFHLTLVGTDQSLLA